eukprot:750672-Hanusia_phi.AAC.1
MKPAGCLRAIESLQPLRWCEENLLRAPRNRWSTPARTQRRRTVEEERREVAEEQEEQEGSGDGDGEGERDEDEGRKTRKKMGRRRGEEGRRRRGGEGRKGGAGGCEYLIHELQSSLDVLGVGVEEGDGEESFSCRDVIRTHRLLAQRNDLRGTVSEERVGRGGGRSEGRGEGRREEESCSGGSAPGSTCSIVLSSPPALPPRPRPPRPPLRLPLPCSLPTYLLPVFALLLPILTFLPRPISSLRAKPILLLFTLPTPPHLALLGSR